MTCINSIVSSAFHANPAETLKQIRANGSSVIQMRLPIFGKTRLCVTYEGCAAMLTDHATFVRDSANAGIRIQARILNVLPRSIGLLALSMLGLDDPRGLWVTPGLLLKKKFRELSLTTVLGGSLASPGSAYRPMLVGCDCEGSSRRLVLEKDCPNSRVAREKGCKILDISALSLV